MTPEERAVLQAVLDDMHDQFVTAVAEGRRLAKERVRALADGRVYSGRMAKDLGLVDSLGGLDEAVRMAGEMGGHPGQAAARPPPPRLAARRPGRPGRRGDGAVVAPRVGWRVPAARGPAHPRVAQAAPLPAGLTAVTADRPGTSRLDRRFWPVIA